uniref:Uncharacterized protein n=1 Tax=Mola mola TaxID=94237 RepID=A0A3Q4A963_MOLML
MRYFTLLFYGSFYLCAPKNSLHMSAVCKVIWTLKKTTSNRNYQRYKVRIILPGVVGGVDHTRAPTHSEKLDLDRCLCFSETIPRSSFVVKEMHI